MSATWLQQAGDSIETDRFVAMIQLNMFLTTHMLKIRKTVQTTMREMKITVTGTSICAKLKLQLRECISSNAYFSPKTRL